MRKLFPLLALIASFAWADQTTAQDFSTLHDFGDGSDGALPEGELILSGNTLYGTTSTSGSLGGGTAFAINRDGTGFTNLHPLDGTPWGMPPDAKGVGPRSGLLLSGDFLFGTTHYGGDWKFGSVFKLATNGSSFAILHSFSNASGYGTNSDGARPVGTLMLSGNTLYGSTYDGGLGGRGTLFAINTDGTEFTNLYNFTSYNGYPYPGTNIDGAGPQAALILAGDTLYGTTSEGGASGYGTIFSIKTNGADFTVLHNFLTFPIDGARPLSKLVLSGKNLYGTTIGGTGGGGRIFRINTNGADFTVIYSFPPYLQPQGGVILSGRSLYGTVRDDVETFGSIFRIDTNGFGFSTVYNFSGTDDGIDPLAGLILSDNILYGTARRGGNSDNGTVFSFSLPSPPQLTITLVETNLILTWPTNTVGFTLQSTTNLVSPIIWNTNFPEPTIVHGQNTVTNPIAGTQNFYRLSQ